MNENPFQILIEKINNLETILDKVVAGQSLKVSKSKSSEENLTRKEVCERYKISLGTLHKYMRSGKLRYIKTGRKTLFRVEDVKEFFGQNNE